MDELVIGDKKYISSKRAAELTGYAKDYIGQLCREGRVEARLVGRSWYVLESSISEHRFGKETQEIPQNEAREEATEGENEIASWNAPRYVSETVEPLPILEKPQIPVTRESLNILTPQARQEVSDISSIQAVKLEKEEVNPEEAKEEEETKPKPDFKEESQDSVAIPIHKIEKTPIEAHAHDVQAPKEQIKPKKRIQNREIQKKGSKIAPALIIAVAIIAISIMVLGTGVLEENQTFKSINSSFLNFLGGKSYYFRQ